MYGEAIKAGGYAVVTEAGWREQQRFDCTCCNTAHIAIFNVLLRSRGTSLMGGVAVYLLLACREQVISQGSLPALPALPTHRDL